MVQTVLRRGLERVSLELMYREVWGEHDPVGPWSTSKCTLFPVSSTWRGRFTSSLQMSIVHRLPLSLSCFSIISVPYSISQQPRLPIDYRKLIEAVQHLSSCSQDWKTVKISNLYEYASEYMETLCRNYTYSFLLYSFPMPLFRLVSVFRVPPQLL